MDKEEIIKKCFAIAHFATERGRATLRKDEKTFNRANKILDDLVKKLEHFIKNG